MRQLLLITVLTFFAFAAHAQQTDDFMFALVTDTHIGNQTADEDLRRTVNDINDCDSLAFVIFSGDVTEFGSDAELLLTRQILDSLNKPWYIIPGNHDTKWSESGGNSFRKIFGAETFTFTWGNFRFIGTNSGPNMRMGPGQIPRENIVWLDSLLKAPGDDDRPLIFINHYPLDAGLNNWYEAIDRLKKRNIQLSLCGHGHTNREMNFEGIPALMGRSNLRARDSVGAYNIMHVYGDTLVAASVRYPSVKTTKPWAVIKLTDHNFSPSQSDYPRPDFTINSVHPNVREVWRIEEQSDIGSGLASTGEILISTGTDGFIKARSISNGSLKWQYPAGAKIYGTPAISENRVFISATDGNVLALSLDKGELIWKFNTGERIVASPVINEDRIIITGSGGKCYSLSLADGSIIWCNNTIRGFVETMPLIHNDMVFFGTWDNRFYALDVLTGATLWEWHDGYANRMLSPAACVPAVADDRLFVVAPDRKMTSLDASTGNIVWQSKIGDSSVRESMGLSADSSLIFAKTMEGDIIGVSVSDNEPKIRWKADTNIGYDIAPSVIVEYDGIVYVPTDKGFVYAFSRETGKLIWAHRISACLINQILPVNRHEMICTSMDGVITRLRYQP